MSNYITWLDRADFPAVLPIRLQYVGGNGVAMPLGAPAPSFDQALATLDQLLATHQITPRDLKCRFDGCSVAIQDETIVFTVRIGPTHYDACRQDMDQPVAVAQKVQLGLAHFQDAKHYLTCGMGVVVLPYTPDGRVLLGVRHGIEYDGLWNGVAGWLPFTRNIAAFDPVAHARQECVEELGISEDQLRALDFLGIAAFQASYETDLVFKMGLPQEIAAALVDKQLWKAAQDAHEHAHFALVSPEEALASEQKLMPSTEFGLHALAAQLVSV